MRLDKPRRRTASAFAAIAEAAAAATAVAIAAWLHQRRSPAMCCEWSASLPSPYQRERVPLRLEREHATLPINEPERWSLL